MPAAPTAPFAGRISHTTRVDCRTKFPPTTTEQGDRPREQTLRPRPVPAPVFLPAFAAGRSGRHEVAAGSRNIPAAGAQVMSLAPEPIVTVEADRDHSRPPHTACGESGGMDSASIPLLRRTPTVGNQRSSCSVCGRRTEACFQALPPASAASGAMEVSSLSSSSGAAGAWASFRTGARSRG